MLLSPARRRALMAGLRRRPWRGVCCQCRSRSGDVPHIVQLVLDGPVAADPGGQIGGVAVVGRDAGDRVDGRTPPFHVWTWRLICTACEQQPGGNVDHLARAALLAAVTAVFAAVVDPDLVSG